MNFYGIPRRDRVEARKQFFDRHPDFQFYRPTHEEAVARAKRGVEIRRKKAERRRKRAEAAQRKRELNETCNKQPAVVSA